MIEEFSATRKDIQDADTAFVQRTASQGICFACRQPCVLLRKIIPGFAVVRHDARTTYNACVNPDCFMHTNLSEVETWEVAHVN